MTGQDIPSNLIDDNILTSQELYDYLYSKVSKYTSKGQLPQINDEGYKINIPIFIINTNK